MPLFFMCLYIFSLSTCLCPLIYCVPKYAHFSYTHVPKIFQDLGTDIYAADEKSAEKLIKLENKTKLEVEGVYNLLKHECI